MLTIEKTVAALRERFVDANFGPITLNMKCNGDAVTITPCTSLPGNPTSFDQVEYYLVASPSLPWLGGDTLEHIAKQLNGYADAIAENDDEKAKLAAMKEKLTNGSITSSDEWEATFEMYSDWHKDVYGYRPRDVKRPVF